MSDHCAKITQLFSQAHRFAFPFDPNSLPTDGIYVLFERNENGHGYDRIVRVGTHNGSEQLRPRLRQHFLIENKDRSIFRKNIGRAILNRRSDPYLEIWESDRTSLAGKEEVNGRFNLQYQNEIEREVSKVIQETFSFSVIPVYEKGQRLMLESKMISTVSVCDGCQPSENWLGNDSPREKIRNSGLWLVNELYKAPLRDEEMAFFAELANETRE